MTRTPDDGEARRPTPGLRPGGSSRTPSAEEAVLAANAAFYAAVEEGDLDAMSEIWLPNEHGGENVSCVHAGWPMLRGRPEVLRSFALIMANTEYIQFFLTDVEVSLAGADVAVVTCTENILSGGEPEEAESGPGPLVGGVVVATNTFRRAGGEWRLWSHHGSPVLLGSDDDDSEESGPPEF